MFINLTGKGSEAPEMCDNIQGMHNCNTIDKYHLYT